MNRDLTGLDAEVSYILSLHPAVLATLRRAARKVTYAAAPSYR